VKVVLLTPGCVDPDRRANGAEYNATLTRFAQGVKDLAARESLPVYDIDALMLAVQAKGKKENPQFTMIPDSVHPSASGQAVMAYGLLKALGCTAQAASLTIDVAAQKPTPDRCTVKDLKVTDDAVSFVRTDEALPTSVDPDAVPVFKYLPFDQDLNQYVFTVTGLKAGTWKLTVQGLAVGTFAAAELSRGVNLAMKPGPWADLGQRVNQLSAEQEQLYYVRWRQVDLPISLPELQPEKKPMLDKLDSLIAVKEAARIKAAENRTWTWSLTRETAAATESSGK